jgi:hypothetical protein
MPGLFWGLLGVPLGVLLLSIWGKISRATIHGFRYDFYQDLGLEMRFMENVNLGHLVGCTGSN